MQTPKILRVSAFNQIAAYHLQQLGELVVEGEISQINISQGKWLYLTLKDDYASVSVFAPAFKISGVEALEEGMKVHVYGVANLYQKTGKFSLTAFKIVPAGEGALKLAYEKLKQQLEKEGLFDTARKRKITPYPEKIGLITAKGSRAYSDFVKVLQERMGGITIHFYPVQVQGNDSVPTLLQAFSYFNNSSENYDALVVTRGGGSLEDLISFNDELVARAIFASKIPVVSAIGHEEDVALTDYVADLRASTPSNAAELLVRDRRSVELAVDHQVQRLDRLITTQLQTIKETLDHSLMVLDEVVDLQQEKYQRLLNSLERVIQLSLQQVAVRHTTLQTKATHLHQSLQRLLQTKQKDFQQLERLLHSLDYRQVLKRGYSISKNQAGGIIKNSQQLQPGEKLITLFAEGEVTSTVEVSER